MAQNISLLANRRLRVSTNKCVLIKRTLEGPGTLTVVAGSQVFPNDLIGSASVVSGFSSINLSHDLGVSPKSGLKYLQRGIGEKFFQGELLAMKKNIFGKKVIVAPVDCILESYDDKTGHIKLKYLPHQRPLIAGVYGMIEQVNIPFGEVFIKTMVTEIWGVLGNGNQKIGFLNILNQQGDITQAAQISPQNKGQILVGGGLFYGDAIKMAAEYGVAGIVCGGINSADFKAVNGSIYPNQQSQMDVGIGILATEGLGAIPIGGDIFKELKGHHGKFVVLDGNTKALWLPSDKSDSILTASKIILPITRTAAAFHEPVVDEIALGMKTRIIRQPFMGSQGVVSGIDQTPTLLDSGISTYMLTIEMPSRKIKVPYTNIEII